VFDSGEKTDLRVPGLRGHVRVLWRSEAALAVDKPAGLAVVPGRGQETCLIDLLRAAWPERDLRLVHRLDQDTSGVMLLALDLAAQRHLTAQFGTGAVRKTYLALVRGRPPEPQGEIKLPIGPDRLHPELMSLDTEHPKEAITRWELVEQLGDFALLRCFPLTGRTHQIRVHLRAAALPLVVDPLYGDGGGLLLSRLKADYRPSRRHDERPLIGRLSLHAAAVEFVDPAGDSPARVEAALPKDFRAALNQLRKLFGVPAALASPDDL